MLHSPVGMQSLTSDEGVRALYHALRYSRRAHELHSKMFG